jgi:hypothetical protein
VIQTCVGVVLDRVFVSSRIANGEHRPSKQELVTLLFVFLGRSSARGQWLTGKDPIEISSGGNICAFIFSSGSRAS